MTTTAPAEATERPRLSSLRRTALVAGALYILTFVSIPVLGLYGPVHDPTYILGPGPDSGVVYGVLLELVVALAGIGTAITLFPVVKRQNESLALGFVATRTLEAALIFVGAVALLSVVTLRQDLAGAGGSALIGVGTALVAVYDWTFSLGQGLMPVANAVLLGTLLYRRVWCRARCRCWDSSAPRSCSSPRSRRFWGSAMPYRPGRPWPPSRSPRGSSRWACGC